MSERTRFLKSIAETIADYREGDVPRRGPAEVQKWVSQFPEDAQDGILAEMEQLLSKTYISRNDVTSFLKGLATDEKFCDGDPRAFWKRANLLDIQQGGNSQREMLAMFGEILQQEIGLGLSDCGSDGGPFIYLDDGIFTGTRVVKDLSAWIQNMAPPECEVRIVVAALHTLGRWYVEQEVDKLKTKTKKKISLSGWYIHEIENRKAYKDTSDVLWPTEVPAEPLAEAYVRYITEEEPTYELALRSGTSVGKNKFFSSDNARKLLEQQFLVAGLHIRDKWPNLPETLRPLGATPLKTFGFGSTIVTFRNCPNNCPLALWVGDPWYPLFPRSTNSEAFLKRLLKFLHRGKAKET